MAPPPCGSVYAFAVWAQSLCPRLASALSHTLYGVAAFTIAGPTCAIGLSAELNTSIRCRVRYCGGTHSNNLNQLTYGGCQGFTTSYSRPTVLHLKPWRRSPTRGQHQPQAMAAAISHRRPCLPWRTFLRWQSTLRLEPLMTRT